MQNEPAGKHLIFNFELIRMKICMVLKHFKLNSLILLLSELREIAAVLMTVLKNFNIDMY